MCEQGWQPVCLWPPSGSKCVNSTPLCVNRGGSQCACGHPAAALHHGVPMLTAPLCVCEQGWQPVCLWPPSGSKCVNSTPLCVNRGGSQCACGHPAAALHHGVPMLTAPLCVCEQGWQPVCLWPPSGSTPPQSTYVNSTPLCV